MKQTIISQISLKKLSAIALSVLILVSIFFAAPKSANALGEQVTVFMINSWPRTFVPNFRNGTNSGQGPWQLMHRPGIDGVPLWCVAPGRPINHGAVLINEGYVDSIRNHIFTDVAGNVRLQRHMGIIFQYTEDALQWRPQNGTTAAISQYLAVQILLWEVIVGERDWDFNHIPPPAGFGRVTDTLGALTQAQRDVVMYHYNRIVAYTLTHFAVPSFSSILQIAAPTHTLTPAAGGNLSVTLTDTRGVLSRYQFSTTQPGITFTRNGNQLTITATQPFSGVVNIDVETINQMRSGHITFGGQTGPQPVAQKVGQMPTRFALL